MNRWSILLCLFLSSPCAAQPDLRTSYYRYDSCPDPVKYRIASRTIYNVCPDSNLYCFHDTTREYFDRKGALTSQINHMPDINHPGSYSSRENYFFYDAQGKIILDSSIYFNGSHIRRYDYFPSENKIIIRENEFGALSVTTVFYDSSNRDTSRLQVSENGDTVLRMITRGDTIIHTRYFRSMDNITFTQDSITVIFAGHSVTTSIAYPYRGPASTSQKTCYNARGKITDEMFYADNALYDSTHCEYDAKGRLIHKTRFAYPYELSIDTTRQIYHTVYTYNKKGRCTTICNWEIHEPEKKYITRYVYNRKGLRIQERRLVKTGNEKEKVESVQVWEYEYY